MKNKYNAVTQNDCKEVVPSQFDNYKIEDLILLNMYTRTSSKTGIKDYNFEIFAIEDELSVEQKIKFIDEQHMKLKNGIKNGIASYMLNLLKKWDEEKDSLPKDSWKLPKTVSSKAWIKRNDPLGVIDNDYKIGSYYLFGTKFKHMTLTCPLTEYNSPMAHDGEDVIHQWFHDLCHELKNKELKYFKEHDDFQKKLSQLREYGNQYGCVFNSKDLNDIVWNSKEDVSEKILDIYLEAYESLKDSIGVISKSIEDSEKQQ